MLKRALHMALHAHAGQVEKDGGAFIVHPLRVMDFVRHEDELVAVVAVLHDVVEDSEITLQDVRVAFSDEVADAVDAVTRRDDETYMESIERAKLHPVGRVVKLADLADHLRVGHEKQIPESLIKRYHKALALMGKR